ncbi:MAG: N-acetylmuramic acid 6-phosphate etherase, partial [Candidatus Hydrogenedentes bacterium]|nr:N-acetylmuramic acid 6-phosphate etherase [Candidatus Hydrogenedentota bacterium]
PYMLGALKKARDMNAKTALITSNPAASAQVDILIAPDTGAEVLPGSTRLKAGTAAKLILNMISTGAMAQAGYVYQGRMVNMTPANEKLRERAQRIVAEISGSSREEASHRLDACNYHISEAIIMAKYNLSAEEAATRLQNHNGHLREALK